MRESVCAVVAVEAGVVLRAVQAQPEAIGRGDELRGVVKELSADLSSGVLAVDDEAADVAGVVGRVVPQLAVGLVAQ